VTIGFRGRPLEIRYSAGLLDIAGNPAHAASFIRQRLIVLDAGLRRDPAGHARILAHELFHFVWVRLGNPARLEWERAMRTEFENRVSGDAGWSAEWRKTRLTKTDIRGRTRAWREYCCESFCDTAAVWLTGSRTEATLSSIALRSRTAQLSSLLAPGHLPI
jgi:hypothetical protein